MMTELKKQKTYNELLYSSKFDHISPSFTILVQESESESFTLLSEP